MEIWCYHANNNSKVDSKRKKCLLYSLLARKSTPERGLRKDYFSALNMKDELLSKSNLIVLLASSTFERTSCKLVNYVKKKETCVLQRRLSSKYERHSLLKRATLAADRSRWCQTVKWMASNYNYHGGTQMTEFAIRWNGKQRFSGIFIANRMI